MSTEHRQDLTKIFEQIFIENIGTEFVVVNNNNGNIYFKKKYTVIDIKTYNVKELTIIGSCYTNVTVPW